MRGRRHIVFTVSLLALMVFLVGQLVYRGHWLLYVCFVVAGIGFVIDAVLVVRWSVRNARVGREVPPGGALLGAEIPRAGGAGGADGFAGGPAPDRHESAVTGDPVGAAADEWAPADPGLHGVGPHIEVGGPPWRAPD